MKRNAHVILSLFIFLFSLSISLPAFAADPFEAGGGSGSRTAGAIEERAGGAGGIGGGGGGGGVPGINDGDDESARGKSGVGGIGGDGWKSVTTPTGTEGAGGEAGETDPIGDLEVSIVGGHGGSAITYPYTGYPGSSAGGGGGGGAGVVYDTTPSDFIITSGTHISGGNGGDTVITYTDYHAGGGGGGGAALAIKTQANFTNYGSLTGGNGGQGFTGAQGGVGLFVGGHDGTNFGGTFGGEITNAVGATITGGKGGASTNSENNGNQGGNGAAGVRGNNISLINRGTITGGEGARGGGTDINGEARTAGLGGAGVQVYSAGPLLYSTVTNETEGIITGGDAYQFGTGDNIGVAPDRHGGVGVYLTGDYGRVVNAGTIEGGKGRFFIDNDNVHRNFAVRIGDGSNNNVVELHAGYNFIGHVGSRITTNSGNVLLLAGDDNAAFNVSKIKTGHFNINGTNSILFSKDYYYYNFNKYEKDGDSTWTLTETTTEDTPWTIRAGKLSVSKDGNLGSDTAALTLAGGTLLATDTFSTNRDIVLTGLTGNGLEVAADKNLTANGVVSGGQGFVKSGPGTLTLAGANTFTGAADLSAGTLALSGSGHISSASGLTMAGGTAFDIRNITAASTSVISLTIAGAGASITASGKSLTLVDNKVTADISGLANNAIMLDADDAITTDTSTNVSLAGIPSLKRGQSVTILQNLDNASDFTDVSGLTYGRHLFDLALDGTDLMLSSAGYTSFRADSDSLFNPVGLNNINIRNGSDYLDRLDDADDPFIESLAEAYDRATLGRGVGEASRALQQLYGGYAAYANQALASDLDHFRRRWQAQNRFFIDRRLFACQLSGGASASPLAVSGGEDYGEGFSRLWAGGFGGWNEQKSRENLPGYEYDSRGLALGYEYSRDNFNLGLAAAYSGGDLKINELGYKNEADVLNLALYGTWLHDSGFYLEGGLGYGHARNDYRVHSLSVPGGVKKGKYDSDAFSLDLELGYLAQLAGGFNLIPSLGLEYRRLKNDSWTESVNQADLVANRFSSGHDSGLNIPVGLRLNKLISFDGGEGFLVPEIRAAYVYAADKSRPSINAGYAGTRDGSAEMLGVDPGHNHWRLGAGLTGQVNDTVDLRLSYDFETGSSFTGHNLTGTIGFSF